MERGRRERGGGRWGRKRDRKENRRRAAEKVERGKGNEGGTRDKGGAEGAGEKVHPWLRKRRSRVDRKRGVNGLGPFSQTRGGLRGCGRWRRSGAAATEKAGAVSARLRRAVIRTDEGLRTTQEGRSVIAGQFWGLPPD